MNHKEEKNIFIIFVLALIVGLWYMFNESFQIGASYVIMTLAAFIIITIGRQHYG